MSKASEWAVREHDIEQAIRAVMKNAPCPTFYTKNGAGYPLAAARVRRYHEEHFHLSVNHNFSPEDAVSFAHWILDTFGDAPAPEGSAT